MTALFLMVLAISSFAQVTFSRMDTVYVRWDVPAETDISFYTMHFSDQADTNKQITVKVAQWEVMNSEAKWQTKYNVVLPVGTYSLRMTATDTANNRSLFSDAIYFTVIEPGPLKPRGVILIVKPYRDN